VAEDGEITTDLIITDSCLPSSAEDLEFPQTLWPDRPQNVQVGAAKVVLMLLVPPSVDLGASVWLKVLPRAKTFLR
jgi:hypothetical protein